MQGTPRSFVPLTETNAMSPGVRVEDLEVGWRLAGRVSGWAVGLGQRLRVSHRAFPSCGGPGGWLAAGRPGQRHVRAGGWLEAADAGVSLHRLHRPGGGEQLPCPCHGSKLPRPEAATPNPTARRGVWAAVAEPHSLDPKSLPIPWPLNPISEPQPPEEPPHPMASKPRL
jgi:hypothetical protein